MGVEHGEPLQAKRQDQQQENPGQQPELTELAKAREALIVFVAGTERTSARSKAFSNLVSQQEMPLLFPRWQLHGETASQQNDRLIFDI